MPNRVFKFNKNLISFNYQSEADLSVIDEIFTDKMYRAAEKIILDIQDPILDIGAHIGCFSVYANVLNPKVKIIALEPEPNNFKLLKENLKLNHCKNVTAMQCAVILSESERRVEGSSNTTTLYLNEDSHNHSTFFETEKTLEVPATTLENLITKHKLQKIGLLKMDIEGAEFEIIKTLKHENIKTITNMVIEYHEFANNKRNDLENIIRSQGFSIEHFPNHFDKRFGLLVCRNKK